MCVVFVGYTVQMYVMQFKLWGGLAWEVWVGLRNKDELLIQKMRLQAWIYLQENRTRTPSLSYHSCEDVLVKRWCHSQLRCLKRQSRGKRRWKKLIACVNERAVWKSRTFFVLNTVLEQNYDTYSIYTLKCRYIEQNWIARWETEVGQEWTNVKWAKATNVTMLTFFSIR